MAFCFRDFTENKIKARNATGDAGEGKVLQPGFVLSGIKLGERRGTAGANQ
jgi:hypothetical protein